MAFPSKVVSGTGGVNSVSAYNVETGSFYMADQNHPHYEAILSGLSVENPAVWELFDVATGVVNRLQTITERISWDGANIRFDGDPIHSVLASQLQRAMEQGESNLEALARFWEKLASNPNEHSRDQAYAWLATHDFKITGEGDIVAYKGVRFNDYTDAGNMTYTSISSGTAFVDGVEHKGYIPNAIGSVVSMPRSDVAHDPAVACHYGLHAGDWSYASDFAQGAVLEVHINPRDVVSVPVDCGARKVRTCKYTVVNVVESEYTGGPVLKPDAVASSWTPDVSYAG